MVGDILNMHLVPGFIILGVLGVISIITYGTISFIRELQKDD